MIHDVEHVMGLPVTIAVPDRDAHGAAVAAAFALLREVDARFSLYRDDSELSALNRGTLALADADPSVRSVLARCEELRRITRGSFDAAAAHALWTGGAAVEGIGLDPTGLVKGWAVQLAADGLTAAGVSDAFVGAAGDVCVRGEAGPGTPWEIGIQHPFERDQLAAVLKIRDAAVATSGTYARGAHIVDPHTGRAPEGLASVTVVGPDLGTADAFATAAFAMGDNGPRWLMSLEPDYAALVITADGELVSTPGMARLRAS
ncbi:MAG TPA: FAD:protein FMN transferase [Baekduia sp.]